MGNFHLIGYITKLMAMAASDNKLVNAVFLLKSVRCNYYFLFKKKFLAMFE